MFASESRTLNSGHMWWQFTPCVTRRTLSPHAAQAWTNALVTGRGWKEPTLSNLHNTLQRPAPVPSCDRTQARASSYSAAPFSTNSCFGVTVPFLVTPDPAEVSTLAGWGSPLLGGPSHPITRWPSLPPPSFTRSPFGSPYASPTPYEENYELTTFRPSGLRGSGPSSTPGAHHLR